MLTEKIQQLKSEAATAGRIAAFWEQKIAEHGEIKVEAFYHSLFPNGKKSIEWEGLKLSRQPTAAEQLCVKSVASAQETAKERVTTVLLKARTELIAEGLKGIQNLAPADYHVLTLSVTADLRQKLRDGLLVVYQQGRDSLASQLSKKQAEFDTEFDELDDLVDVSDARVANDVQSRIIAAAARFTLLGLAGAALQKAIRDEIQAGSVSYIDRAATGLANRVINIGRTDEGDARRDEWDRVEYSALLDANVCSPCAAEDGTTAASEEDLTPVPNPDCAGGDWCRCFHIFINQ